MLHGSTSWWAHALGQGFTHRFDPLGQQGQEVGWSIEQYGQGYLVLCTTTAYTNQGEYYDPIVLSMTLEPNGEIASIDTVVFADHALYPGTWNCMNRRSGGGFVAGGGTVSQTETNRAALYKVSASGLVEFVDHYGPEGESWIGRQVIECKDGGFLMVGETGEFGMIDGMLIKTDSSGVMEWQRNYGGPMRDYFYTTDTTLTEDIYVAGGMRFVEENIDWWAMRLTSVGDTVWARTWGSDVHDLIPGISTKRNGNMLFASGWNIGEDDPISRVYMAELDQNTGDIVWEREYGPTLNFTILRVAKEVAQGEGHIATGFAFAENSNFWQGILLRTADNGDSLWMRRYFYYDSLMTDGMGELNDVIPTLDGGFIACGFTQGAYTGLYPPGYSQDVWVVKVDSLGCIIPGCDDFSTVITVQATNLKEALAVYPNPAHGSTTLKVTLPSGSPLLGRGVGGEVDLRLRLVNAQGQEVLVQKAVVGENNLAVEGEAAGLYYIHLTSGTTWLSGTKLIIE